MKRLLLIILTAYLVHAPSALAIVDPVAADIEEHDWMANVLVK